MHPTEPNIKRKNVSPMRVIVNQWGCLLALVMLGLGAGMGLLGAIFVGPELLGFDLTATALMDRELALAATDVDLDVREQNAISEATGFALDVQATQAILGNEEDLLAQTATQSAQNIIATNTASAVQNAQRQTQVANDFAATQSALNANATQIEIDFRNTQAALGVGNAQSDNNVVSTPLPRYTFDMTEFDFSNSLWQLSAPDDWDNNQNGLLAVSDGAWLRESEARILSNYGFDIAYTIEVTLTPATVTEEDYWVLFDIGEETGLAAYFHSETLSVREVGLYSFDVSLLDDSLTIDSPLTVIQRNAANVALSGQTQLAVTIAGQTVSFSVNEEVVFTADGITIETGAIGVQLPAQSTLLSIGVDG